MTGSRNLRQIFALALALVGAVLMASSGIASGQPQKQSPALSITDLAWIAGDWQTLPGKMQNEERWIEPAGGLMLGVGRTLAGGKAVFFEFLRIESRADGIYYVAHPQAMPGTDFKLTRLSASEALFENPAHDFPKRIIYRKNADGSLTARIEGDGTEKEKPQEFHFQRMK